MQNIVDTLGNIVSTLTEFFSYIAPGYLVLILCVFMGLMPYVMYRLMKKMVMSHA